MTHSDPYAVLLDLEDAEAIATNIAEHLQYDDHPERSFWEPILHRLEASIAHSNSLN
jgi:hypothetical protein